MIRQLRETIARLRRENEAVAAVEFALVLPLLIALYFGSIEASALFTADRRVNTVSATVGDLFAQWDDDDGSIPTATQTNYFQASTGLMYPMSTTGLHIVVSGVSISSTGVTNVVWSRGYNGATPRTVNTTYPLTQSAMMNQVSRTVGFIIASEVYYPYTPLLGVMFPTEVNLYHENLYIPRYAAALAVQ